MIRFWLKLNSILVKRPWLKLNQILVSNFSQIYHTFPSDSGRAPVGLAGGVEHSRLKSVGEWLLRSRGLNPATARACGGKAGKSDGKTRVSKRHSTCCLLAFQPDGVRGVRAPPSSGWRLASTVSWGIPGGRTTSALEWRRRRRRKERKFPHIISLDNFFHSAPMKAALS